MNNIRLHKGDLPNLDRYNVDSVAVDTETLGLNVARDRLCVIQLSCGDGTVDIVQIGREKTPAPNLQKIFADNNIVKIFHYARFDLAAIANYFGEMPVNIFCTKIASRLCRTYSSRHGLKELCNELLGIPLSKQQQSSDWGSDDLTPMQQQYAAGDVLYLHKLRNILQEKLKREGRYHFAEKSFAFLPTRVELDLAGWENQDIFSHSLNEK